jgi:hypothetical protein
MISMSGYAFKAREAVMRLRTDTGGVISFEYVMVAACIVGAASTVFGGAGAGTAQWALTAGLTAIANTIAAAV